jgi:hypothetical protein
MVEQTFIMDTKLYNKEFAAIYDASALFVKDVVLDRAQKSKTPPIRDGVCFLIAGIELVKHGHKSVPGFAIVITTDD